MSQARFTLPSLDDLIHKFERVLDNYLKAKFPTDDEDADELLASSEESKFPDRKQRTIKDIQNPVRKQFFHLLDSIHKYIKTVSESDISAHDKELICMGAWIYCMEKLVGEYSVLDPVYSEGMMVSYGSEMLKFMLEELGIKQLNEIDDQLKYIYLQKFYQFAFDEKNFDCSVDDFIDDENEVITLEEYLETFPDRLRKKKIDVEAIKKQVENTIQNLLSRLHPYIVNLTKETPFEDAMTDRLSHFYTDYVERCKPSSYFWLFKSSLSIDAQEAQLAQLIEMLSVIYPAKDEENKRFVESLNDEELKQMNQNDVMTSAQNEELTRSKKIKMGALLYLLYALPASSELYQMALRDLNIDSLDDFDVNTKISRLSAFDNFLNDNKFINTFIKKGKERFGNDSLLDDIDPTIFRIHHNQRIIINQLMEKAKPIEWPAAKTLSEIFELICAFPGYGMGMFVGYVSSETCVAVEPKILLANGINNVGTAILGTAGGLAGYFASNFIINNTLMRLFAIVLQEVGKLIGMMTGAAIGISFDLSFKGFYNLCDFFFYLYKHADNNIKNCVNPEFIMSLIETPEPLLSSDAKDRIQYAFIGDQHQLTMHQQEKYNEQSDDDTEIIQKSPLSLSGSRP